MTEIVKQLDALLERIGAAGPSQTEPVPLQEADAMPDAIDAVLAQPQRQTNVQRLQNDPAMAAFREELVNGLIRVDTVRQFLSVLSKAIGPFSSSA